MIPTFLFLTELSRRLAHAALITLTALVCTSHAFAESVLLTGATLHPITGPTLRNGQSKADARAVVGCFDLGVNRGEVEVEPARVLRPEGVRLQFHDDVALQTRVVGEQVDEELIAAYTFVLSTTQPPFKSPEL